MWSLVVAACPQKTQSDDDGVTLPLYTFAETQAYVIEERRCALCEYEAEHRCAMCSGSIPPKELASSPVPS